MPRRRGPKKPSQNGTAPHVVIDKRSGQDRRDRQERRNGADHHGTVEIHSTISQSDRDRLFEGVSRGYQGRDGQRKIWYNNHPYASNGEIELAKVLDKGHVLFKPHVLLRDCLDQDDLSKTHTYEMDFAFFERQKFPGMTEWVDGLEYKGVLDDRALKRHEAIKFKYHLRVLTAYWEHVDLWKREGLHWPARRRPISPSQPTEHSKEWMDRMASILKVTGVPHERNALFRRIIDPWASNQYHSAKYFNLNVDFLPKHPIKVRGFSHYIDGIIVRSRFERDDLEALHLLRGEPYYKRFIIAIPTVIKSWINGGLLSTSHIMDILRGT